MEIEMPRLSEEQRRFTVMVGKLILWADLHDYGLTFGEAWRSPTTAAAYAEQAKGIANSLHCERLAIDLNLFIDGVYHGESQAYLPLGEYWESIGGNWGGRFSKPDENHFSLEYGGRR